jgi:hypothetical protein
MTTDTTPPSDPLDEAWVEPMPDDETLRAAGRLMTQSEVIEYALHVLRSAEAELPHTSVVWAEVATAVHRLVVWNDLPGARATPQATLDAWSNAWLLREALSELLDSTDGDIPWKVAEVALERTRVGAEEWLAAHDADVITKWLASPELMDGLQHWFGAGPLYVEDIRNIPLCHRWGCT